MKYLEVGKIVSTHGIKGEVKVKVITDNLNRFIKDCVLYVDGNNQEKERIVCDNYRVLNDKKDMILFSFNNITNINDVLCYIKKTIYVDVDEVRESDEIYYDDLIDCNVVINGKENEVIGIVTDIMEVPQGIILDIKKTNGKSSLVPYIDEFIEEIRIKDKIIVINPIEGLL